MILGLGGSLNVVFVLLFTDRREGFLIQGGYIAVVTAMVVTGLLLVWFLDHPYENDSGSIAPDEMRRSIEIMGLELRRYYDLAPPDGRPETA